MRLVAALLLGLLATTGWAGPSVQGGSTTEVRGGSATLYRYIGAPQTTLLITTTTTTTTTEVGASTTSTTLLTTESNALWFPTTQMPASTVLQVYQAVNAIRCARSVLRTGISNATKLAWGVSNNSAFVISVGLYDTTGATQIATSGGVTPATGGVVAKVTGLPPFSLAAGTPYLVCWCSASTDGSIRSASTIGEIPAAQTGIVNAFVGNILTSTSVCTGGVLPTAVTGLATTFNWSVFALYISKE